MHASLPSGQSWTAEETAFRLVWAEWRRLAALALKTGMGVSCQLEDDHVVLELVYAPRYRGEVVVISPTGAFAQGCQREQDAGDETPLLCGPAGLPWLPESPRAELATEPCEVAL